MMERVDTVLDIETLGLEPGCVVLSVGAVALLWSDMQVVSRLEVTIDVGSSMSHGLTIDPATFKWWMRQSEEARTAAFKGEHSLRNAAETFSIWFEAWTSPLTRCWARGDLDHMVWGHAIRRTGRRVPWGHSAVRDTRTLLDLELPNGRKDPPRSSGAHHTALADAEYEVIRMRDALGFPI